MHPHGHVNSDTCIQLLCHLDDFKGKQRHLLFNFKKAENEQVSERRVKYVVGFWIGRSKLITTYMTSPCSQLTSKSHCSVWPTLGVPSSEVNTKDRECQLSPQTSLFSFMVSREHLIKHFLLQNVKHWALGKRGDTAFLRHCIQCKIISASSRKWIVKVESVSSTGFYLICVLGVESNGVN